MRETPTTTEGTAVGTRVVDKRYEGTTVSDGPYSASFSKVVRLRIIK